MKNNTFNINRFALFCQQNFMHSYKLLSIFLIGFSGGLFILLFIMDIASDFHPMGRDEFFALFLFISIPLAILYTGAAFPGFRTKEKSYNYILNPASTLEKFVFEFFNRIVLFLIVVPLLFWLMFTLEEQVGNLIHPGRTIAGYGLKDVPTAIGHSDKEAVVWIKLMIVSLSALIFTIPFTGAAIFTKFPVLKTLFGVAILFFFHLGLAYFFFETLGYGRMSPEEGDSILFINSEIDMFRFMAIYAVLFNVGLLVTAYLKLREKEV